ncbi:MAG TPA: FMN-binding glutamate synthase family protein, partial [Limnochordales bacterium]
FVARLLSEPYRESLWALIAGLEHSPPMITVENSLRASTGQTPSRPVGPPRRYTLDGVSFRPAQLARRPLQPEEPVDTRVVIGPAARRPMHLDIPVLVGAMAYGTALARDVVLAIAAGASRAGTAYNAGNAPWFDRLRRACSRLVVQVTGTPMVAPPHAVRQADAVEVRVGRGAWAGAGEVVDPGSLAPAVRRAVSPSHPLVVPAGALAPGPAGEQLRGLVQHLRELAGGAPVGVKLAAGHDLEADLDVALGAGVDFVAVDGREGGTHGSPPILQDDFGIPTLHAVCRARRHLDRRGAGRQVSLLVGGGLLTPGDCLKCLALGADAVYLGTAVLFAAAHLQSLMALPWEPAMALVSAGSRLGRRFRRSEGERTVARFLQAVVAEMAVGARALGRRALREVGRDDLVALDEATATVTGLPLAASCPLTDDPNVL